MDGYLPALRTLSARLGDRRRAQRTGAAERRSTQRAAPAAEPDAQAAAGLDFDALAQLGGWVDESQAEGLRHAPAELLYALIERMGGMPSSRWKGMHVNQVV